MTTKDYQAATQKLSEFHFWYLTETRPGQKKMRELALNIIKSIISNHYTFLQNFPVKWKYENGGISGERSGAAAIIGDPITFSDKGVQIRVPKSNLHIKNNIS